MLLWPVWLKVLNVGNTILFDIKHVWIDEMKWKGGKESRRIAVSSSGYQQREVGNGRKATVMKTSFTF